MCTAARGSRASHLRRRTRACRCSRRYGLARPASRRDRSVVSERCGLSARISHTAEACATVMSFKMPRPAITIVAVRTSFISSPGTAIDKLASSVKPIPEKRNHRVTANPATAVNRIPNIEPNNAAVVRWEMPCARYSTITMMPTAPITATRKRRFPRKNRRENERRQQHDRSTDPNECECSSPPAHGHDDEREDNRDRHIFRRADSHRTSTSSPSHRPGSELMHNEPHLVALLDEGGFCPQTCREKVTGFPTASSARTSKQASASGWVVASLLAT